MKLAKVLTSPDGELTLHIMEDEYLDMIELKKAMRGPNWKGEGVYTLVSLRPMLKVNVKTKVVVEEVDAVE